MMPPLWQLDEVGLAGRGRPRLDRLTLAVPWGITAVMGPSGAGKTSLLNVLVGFERPDTGRLRHIAPAGGTARLPVFWSPPDEGLWPHLTVREHLSAVADRHSVVSHWLESFDLAELSHAYPEGLSEGERSRLSVARALSSGAAVLVLDEPLAHVDPLRTGSYWNCLRRYCCDRNASVVFASHDPTTVLREAGEVICLHAGRVAWQGAVTELYDRPPSRQLGDYLGPVNWFERDAASRWLGREQDAPLGLRPERLKLLPDDHGPLVVEQSRGCGSTVQTDVRDTRTGNVRQLIHRPAACVLRTGMRVAISASLMLCVALWCTGCDSPVEGKTMPLTVARIDALPVVGAALPTPRALTVTPMDDLLVLDDKGRVLVYGPSGTLNRSWEMPAHDVGNPEGIVVLRNGHIAVADTHYHRVVIFDEQGGVVGMFGEEGEGPGQFIYPADVAQDPHGFLYVSEYGGNDRVQKFTESGEFVVQFGTVGTDPGQFQRASGLLWHAKTLYVADAINNRIQAFRDDGTFLRVVTDPAAGALDYPYEVALAPDASLFIVEYKAGRVTKISLDGTVLGRFGETGRDVGQFWTPWGLAVTSDGRIFVADTGNRRIVELSP
jgi:ABC-type multidrug transport system ATPase subunit/sugar lactone lactonase YvrE